jgi:hypothetical protein
VSPESAIPFQLFLVVPVRMVVEPVEVATALHKEKVKKCKLSKYESRLHPLVYVLAALFDILDATKVTFEGFDCLFLESLGV